MANEELTRFTLRIPAALSQRLHDAAAMDQRSVYTTINRAIEFYLAHHDEAEQELRQRRTG